MSYTWLIVTVLGTGILLWNRTFLGLWVGSKHFVGSFPDLLIVLVVMQLVFIRNDANVIDLTLRLSRKVILGAISVAVSLLAAVILVYFLRMGIVGVCIGIMVGRLILSVAYPNLIGKFLKINLSAQLMAILRPGLVTTIFFLAATGLENILPTSGWRSLGGWVEFFISAGLTACVVLVLAFRLGLSRDQQKIIFTRVQTILAVK
jgi:hypothetical protein